MHLACSSVFCGGGTNQELALHCLYECNGDIMVSAKKRPGPRDKAAVVCDGWGEAGREAGLQTLSPGLLCFSEICTRT